MARRLPQHRQGLAAARRGLRACSASSAGRSAATALLSIFVFCGLLLVGRRLLDVRPRRARDGPRARASARRGAAPPLDGRAARRVARRRQAAALPDPGRASAGARRPAAARSARRSRSAPAASQRARRPSSRACSRTSSRTSGTATSRADRGRRARGVDRSSRAGSAACSSARCSSSSARSRRRASTCLLSPKREFAADRSRGRALRLAARARRRALRLEQAAELVDFEASPATEPLFTINPFAEEGLAALFVTHPPVAERVAAPARRVDPGLERGSFAPRRVPHRGPRRRGPWNAAAPTPTSPTSQQAEAYPAGHLVADADDTYSCPDTGARWPGLRAERPEPGDASTASSPRRNQQSRALAAPKEKIGGDLLSRGVAPRVPSALAGLTSLFGMGRGVSPPV